MKHLAEQIAGHIGKGTPARVVAGRNVTGSMGGSEVTRARIVLDRLLKNPQARGTAAEITLHLSESVSGYLWVSETVRNADRWVDMTSYYPRAATAAEKPVIQKELLWEQETPILDVQPAGDTLLVLDVWSVSQVSGTRILQQKPTDAAEIMDPRGRLVVREGSLGIELPGRSCKGTWRPELDFTCDISEDPVFSPNRNTLEGDDWPPHYSFARAGTLQLIAGTDGRTQIFDAKRKLVGTFETWGSDFVEDYCLGSRRILAAGTAERGATDTVALYEIADRKPRLASSAIELPGPVTALWPAARGAVAVVQNATGNYAAYSLTWDCSR